MAVWDGEILIYFDVVLMGGVVVWFVWEMVFCWFGLAFFGFFFPFPLTVEWISDTQNTVIDPARL